MKYENLYELFQEEDTNGKNDLIKNKYIPSFTKDHLEYSLNLSTHFMYHRETKEKGISEIKELILEYFTMRNEFINPDKDRFLDIKPYKTKNDNLQEINIHITDSTYEHIYRRKAPQGYDLLIKTLLYRLYNRKVCEAALGGVLMVITKDTESVHPVSEHGILNLQYKASFHEHDAYKTAFISGNEGPVLISRLEVIKTKFWKVVQDGDEHNQHFIFVLRHRNKRVVEFWDLEEQHILDLQICINNISKQTKCFERGVWSINFGLNQAVYSIHIHFIAY